MNHRYQASKFVLRMTSLRLKLHHLAQNDLIPRDEFFDYFDGSFFRLIKSHDSINLYTLAYFSFIHRNDPLTAKNGQILRQYCSSNPNLKELHYEYCNTILRFVVGQNKLLFIALIPILSLRRAKLYCQRKASRVLKQLLVYPETSQAGIVDLNNINGHKYREAMPA